jgi:thymidylate synthase
MQADSPELNVSDFEKNGCNYWKQWSDEKGNLTIDYPIRNQLIDIIESIDKDPYGRRHIIDIWNTDRIDSLSLPSCHYSYQFVVIKDTIDLIWTQRSADFMIGVPSDMILATLYLHAVAKATGYDPGDITMNFGHAHIYREHIDGAVEYLLRDTTIQPYADIPYKHFTEWKTSDIKIESYQPNDPIKFLLKE